MKGQGYRQNMAISMNQLYPQLNISLRSIQSHTSLASKLAPGKCGTLAWIAGFCYARILFILNFFFFNITYIYQHKMNADAGSSVIIACNRCASLTNRRKCTDKLSCWIGKLLKLNCPCESNIAFWKPTPTKMKMWLYDLHGKLGF